MYIDVYVHIFDLRISGEQFRLYLNICILIHTHKYVQISNCQVTSYISRSNIYTKINRNRAVTSNIYTHTNVHAIASCIYAHTIYTQTPKL